LRRFAEDAELEDALVRNRVNLTPMSGAPTSVLLPLPVPEALEAVVGARSGLLALGMPGCAACMLLPTSLMEVRRARPGLVVAIGEFATIEDWAVREELLWPRGIRVSRSSVPAMALLVDGQVVASRPGGGPAFIIDRWLEPVLGPPPYAFEEHPTAAELAALDAQAGLIAGHRAVKSRRDAALGAL
jgi:hypothetical protein